MKFIKIKNIENNFSENHFLNGAIRGSLTGGLAGLALLDEKEKNDKKKVLRNLLIGAGTGGLLLGGLYHYFLDNRGNIKIVSNSLKEFKEG